MLVESLPYALHVRYDLWRPFFPAYLTDLSSKPNRKTLTASVEDAIKVGADDVAIHINLGDPDEAEMLRDFGKVARDAEEWDIPLLAMVYGRGPQITNSLDPWIVAHCARVEVELGADMAGSAGLSVGRNIFQHPSPSLMSIALAGLVHENWSVEEVMNKMGEK